jgi:hemerythrin-like domain-containing protein
MSGPMQMYLYVHDAILREVAHYEDVAKNLNRDSADEVAAFSDQIAWFHTAVRAHEHTEEEVLFPALNDRFEYVAESYAFDHEDFEPHVFGGFDDAFGGLSRAGGKGERKAMAQLLYRQSVALHEHMRLHIAKENELLIPKLEAEFDFEEQAKIAGAMAGLIDPPLMGSLVGWMYGGQSAQDREGMVRFLMRILPPEAFAGMSQMLANLGADEWAEVQRRIPELDLPGT